MHTIKIIDLNFQQANNTIASFLIKGKGKPVLVETGPESTWIELKNQLEQHGIKPKELGAVLLTHIHFDHAGAAWRLAAEGVKIYLHPMGLPHLANPERLWQSAAKIYGVGQMDKLWGPMESIDEHLLVPVDDKQEVTIGDLTFTAIHSPGHAIHHIAWKLSDVIFTGDVGGVKIENGPVVPPCPPPDIHIEDWKASIKKILIHHPKELYLTHFGKIETPEAHLDELVEILDDWANWMKVQFDKDRHPKEITPDFMTYTARQMIRKGADKHLQSLYEYANPSWMSVSGLMRYWKLKADGRF
jgi:glyoxylase-like metal-dependent hydrolase (beta-lactamase superfamily II)